MRQVSAQSGSEEQSLSMQPQSIQPTANMSAAEHQARIDLAAAHRIVAASGWSQIIYNHVTLRVPDAPQHFLIKPNDLMYEEVTASSLIKLDLDGKPADESENVNAAGFAIHSAVLAARPEISAVLHIHTDVGMAISAHPDGLRFVTQGALRFYNQISYHEYSGGEEIDECESIQRDLGDSKAMILRHHGLLTCGENVAEALSLARYLFDACKSQLLVEAAVGRDNVLMPEPDVCVRSAQRWDSYGPAMSASEWPAMLRWADRLDSSYRD